MIIKTPYQIYTLSAFIHQLQDEKLLVFYLNQQGKLLKTKLFSNQIRNKLKLSPLSIFVPALFLKAKNIVICHNHPSGNHYPSQIDKDSTKVLQQTGKFFGVKVTDHVIVSRNGFYSVVRKFNFSLKPGLQPRQPP